MIRATFLRQDSSACGENGPATEADREFRVVSKTMLALSIRPEHTEPCRRTAASQRRSMESIRAGIGRLKKLRSQPLSN